MQRNQGEDHGHELAGKLAWLDRRITSLENGTSVARELRALSKAINELNKAMPVGEDLLNAVYTLSEAIRRCGY